MEGLLGHPFEPLESVSIKLLTLKTVLLLALSSLKRVGDFQALSITPFVYGLRPRAGIGLIATQARLCSYGRFESI